MSEPTGRSDVCGPVFIYRLFEDHIHEPITIAYHRTLEGAWNSPEIAYVGNPVVEALWRRHEQTNADGTVVVIWSWTSWETHVAYKIERIELKP